METLLFLHPLSPIPLEIARRAHALRKVFRAVNAKDTLGSRMDMLIFLLIFIQTEKDGLKMLTNFIQEPRKFTLILSTFLYFHIDTKSQLFLNFKTLKTPTILPLYGKSVFRCFFYLISETYRSL